jgi:hypothetical protein
LQIVPPPGISTHQGGDMEYFIIFFAIIAAIAVKRRDGWFGAATRLYIAVFYVLLLVDAAPREVMVTISRLGFLLIFASDIVPVITEYIFAHRSVQCQSKR